MITISDYATSAEGELIKKYTLKNANGMSVEIINLGGIITSLKVPSKKGELKEVVLGYENPEDYFENPFFFGAIIGRYGNRIANAKFKINDEVYQLEANNGPNNLHGGKNSFHTKIWDAKITSNDKVQLAYLSHDGEEGFPGNLASSVTYTLTADNALEITYEATTDKETVVNMTQHTYFNLSGDFSKDILDHQLQLNCDAYLPTDDTMIPTGELKSVKDTPFDFRISKTLGNDIHTYDIDLGLGCGYDHTLVINGNGFRSVGMASSEESGVVMEVLSTEPGVHLYTGNHINSTKKNQQGSDCGSRTGFCLETQHFPDSPNKKDFPSVFIKPEEKYESTTVFKFFTI
ncbi:aldose epimerase family protein [Chryseobacterium sp.]|uniref:aldose epimerase family protein n=1 Tax=Chryseobacterium sp. TaxID=1871047 RepID=UPI00388E0EEA